MFNLCDFSSLCSGDIVRILEHCAAGCFCAFKSLLGVYACVAVIGNNNCLFTESVQLFT